MAEVRVPLGKYISEYSVRNKQNESIPVYSVTNGQGFCAEYFGKEVASKEKTTYKIVPYGYFAYNPSRINVGSVDWQRQEKRVIVSPLYVVFSVSDNIDRQYLYYFLKSDIGRQMIKSKAIGSVRDNLKLDRLKEITIPAITVEEQKHCVLVLNKLQDLISLHRQQLAKLDELVKARFVEMFGDPVRNERNWTLCSLNSVCSSIVDCPHSTPNYTTENTGYRCIRTTIVKKNQILWDRIEYISEDEYYQRIQRKRPEKGDIVYTREGAILGIAAMIDQDCNVALGQRSMLLSPNSVYCCSQFLCVAMNFDSFLNKALEGLGGSASPHINVGDIKSFQIIMPPLELQDQFTRFVEKNNEQRLTIQQSLDKLEVLKKSVDAGIFWVRFDIVYG